jgi:uncharacterized lipoprotein YddW (UPF0748 family)
MLSMQTIRSAYVTRFCVVCTAFFVLPVFAQAQPSMPPKREFRAVWIAAVSNIDWPLRGTDTPDKQRADFIAMLNQHKAMGINAVIAQVRPSADALYGKSREPWSQWLTGRQGQAPSPLWDPLAFMVEETHKRGMELHAWFNPFRSVVSSSSSVAGSHISQTRPDWNLAYTSPFRLLDPGIPEVRQYVTSIVMDVVRGYDIDGVHFDDYFYPYSGTTTQDEATFRTHSRGFTNIADWRRDNVNLTVKMVSDSIRAVKKYIKFGISPFGIWRSGVPSGIVGLDAYSVIYCDATAWLQAQTVDYIMPQLYWKFGGGQDYATLMPWWLGQATQAGRHLYAGLGAYRLDAANGNWLASDITRQVDFNRMQGAHGCSFFSSTQLTSGLKGMASELAANQFKTLALPPTMLWKDSVPPLAPTNLAAMLIAGGLDRVRLSWRKPNAASDSDTAVRYAVYRFLGNDAVNLQSPQSLIAVTQDTLFTDVVGILSRATYVVTSLDRLWNESAATAQVLATLTNVQESQVSFQATGLHALSPNPASELATLRFSLDVPSPVSVTLTDMLGREVWSLWSGVQRSFPAGAQSVDIDVRSLPAGVYLCRFAAGVFVEVRVIVVRK